MGLFSLAGPPLGKVSRLDHTDGVGRSDLPHFPDLPDGVSSNVILQDDVVAVITIVISVIVIATCNYYNTDNS